MGKIRDYSVISEINDSDLFLIETDSGTRTVTGATVKSSSGGIDPEEWSRVKEDLDNLKENGVASSDIEKAVSDYLKKNPVGGLTESQVNTLIDNKLGVIENGTY